jgi:hypothetical protein
MVTIQDVAVAKAYMKVLSNRSKMPRKPLKHKNIQPWESFPGSMKNKELVSSIPKLLD